MDESTEHKRHVSHGPDEQDPISQPTVELPLLSERHLASALSSTDGLNAQASKKAEILDEKRPNVFKRVFLWVSRRLALNLMLLLPLAAFLCAIGHYVFFHYLDATMTQNRRIRQSHVTTISLLVATIFKACIIGAVGLSFAQHLWQTLRQKTFTIGRIEQMFCLRSNPFELTRLRGSLEAPVLFSMAVFMWLVPLAVIYPPSALTVSFRAFSTNKDLDVSILFPLSPDFNPSAPKETHHFRMFQSEWIPLPGKTLSMNYLWANQSVKGLAESILISGKIPDFTSPGGENSSYMLEFRSPQLVCNEKIVDIADTKNIILNGSLKPFEITWSGNMLDANFTITSVRDLRWYPDTYLPWLSNLTFTYEGSVNVLTCEPVSVTYNLSISYTKGVRQIDYTKQDSRPFKPQRTAVFSYKPKSDTRNITLPLSTVFLNDREQWVDSIQQHLLMWNKWALMTATLSTLGFSCESLMQFDTTRTNFTLKNGTAVQGMQLDPVWCKLKTPSLLGKSIFNSQRYNDSASQNEMQPTKLNLDQDTINEYLTNVTISALSLNIGKKKTQVNVTEYRTTYDFSTPINLILPYALCLAFGILFVAIGIWSLAQNGTPATDGGFLQVMTTTIGQTRMEDLAVALQTGGDTDNMSKEMLGLKVRYGELVDAEGIGTGLAAFGTTDETNMLRKSWSSG